MTTYDPAYSYTGPTNAPLATYEDSFHFVVRLALAANRLIKRGGFKNEFFERQANQALRTRGWDFATVPIVSSPGDYTGLVTIWDEGRGIGVAPVVGQEEEHYQRLKEEVPAALAALGAA